MRGSSLLVLLLLQPSGLDLELQFFERTKGDPVEVPGSESVARAFARVRADGCVFCEGPQRATLPRSCGISRDA